MTIAIRAFALLLVLAVGCDRGDVSITPWSPDVTNAEDPGESGDAVEGDELPATDASWCAQTGCLAGFVCVEAGCVPGCATDRDCPEGRYCRPDVQPHGVCSECAADEQCGTGRCVDGQCRVACVHQADCLLLPDAPVCDPIHGVCVGCLGRDDCDPGQLCLLGTCVPGCLADDGCPIPLRCDQASGPNGACVVCVGDAHCSGGRRCVDRLCVFDCDTITCPFDRPLCLPETGACVECIDSASCAGVQVCLGNACRPGCLRDEDCGAGLVCTGGSPGRCVGCETPADCPDEGALCILEQCVTNPCSDDVACGAGRYCHPRLRTCYDLPAASCSQDRDCGLIPGTQIGRNCDPLTRTCIAECLPGRVCLDASMYCIDGSCYGCRTDGDCAGTRCDPFDQACDRCKADADCANANWHCETASGACYPCVFDAHCGAGVRCHPEKHRCVECMIDFDCRAVEGRPVCAKDNTCVASCQDECQSGAAVCAPLTGGGSGIRRCGDFDADPCLEYGAVQACVAGQTCKTVGNVGQCACSEECEAGQAQCIDGSPGSRRVCIVDPATGCPRWVTEACEKGAACNGGVCACTGECQYPSSKCDEKNWTYYYYCGREGGSCLHWIHLKCENGASCNTSTGQCSGGSGGY